MCNLCNPLGGATPSVRGGMAPSCHGGVAPGIDGGLAPESDSGVAQELERCCCLLLGCPICNMGQQGTPGRVFRAAHTRLVDSGRPPSAEMAAVIATVDRVLATMLDPRSSTPKYLQRGPGFTSLSSWSDAQGSRHDYLVGLLCGCGVYSVRQVRQNAKKTEACGLSSLPHPAKRGVRAQVRANDKSDSAVADVQEELIDAQNGEADAEGPTECKGVKGRYFDFADRNPQAHATGLVLGRAYVWGAMNNVSARAMTGLLAQFRLASVDIGQKYHEHGARNMYLQILAKLLRDDTRVSFWDSIKNLQHPSAWRLIFDSITLANGSTEMVIIVVYTNSEGKITAELCDLKNCGKSHTGEKEANLILNSLGQRLSLFARQARCVSFVGLPLEHSSQDLWHRGNFLTCIPCDRAYSGYTGTGADRIIGDKLHIHGVLHLPRRVGMADLFHCYDSSMKKVWSQEKRKSVKVKEACPIDAEDPEEACPIDAEDPEEAYPMGSEIEETDAEDHGN